MGYVRFILDSYRQFVSFVLLAAVLFGGAPAYGQGRRRPAAATPASQPASAPQRCSGGWSGVVTLTKTLKESYSSDEPGIRKDKDRIRHEKKRDYRYTGRAVVDGSDPARPFVGASVTLTDNDLNFGEERVWDTCNSRESGHWFVVAGNDDRVTQAAAQGPARSFNLHVDERGGTYSFSLQFPDAQGVFKREQHTRRSGHCQPKNNEPYDKSTSEPTTVRGEGVSIQAERLNPDSPDTISGSKTWDTSSGRVKSFVYTVTWRFTRCPQKLLITDLRFEHPDFPNFEDWKEVVEQTGTIDGNRVRVTATVLNLSGETKYATLKLSETYKGDRWDGARADEPLPDAVSSLRLDAGEERRAEFVWDTEGQSWFDDGRPHLLHRIKAVLEEAGQKRDEKVKPLNIAPKPVVLVHGLWSSAQAWLPLYPNLLTTSHSYNWKAYAVGERPEHGRLNTGGSFLSPQKTNTIYENADELARYVRHAQEESNAWHVDIVAHSMGGLISRLYIHKLMPETPDGRPLVKHLVMLGTPNAGSPCADVMDMKFELFGERVQAVKDLKPSEVAIFNRHVTNRKRVKFSALAGNPMPVMCKYVTWNDGVVSVESATHGVEDFAYSNDVHTDLTDARNFSNFVKPHLVTGPRGTYPLPVKSDPNDINRWKVGDARPLLSPYGAMFVRASFNPAGAGAAQEAERPAAFARELKLAPGQTAEVEIPVAAAPNFGLTFMADARVSATLLDAGGAARGKSLAGTPEAKAFFRSIFVAKPVGAGAWRLRLENTSRDECVVLLVTWTGAGAK